MRIKLIGLVIGLGLVCVCEVFSQSPSKLSYTVKLSMQGYNLPFKRLIDNFKNPGVTLGINYGYKSDQVTAQSLNVGWFNHAEHGNAIYISTLFHYRPSVGRFKPGVGLGVGRMIYLTNSNPLYEMVGERWQKSSKHTEGRWILPLAVYLGYQFNFGKYNQLIPFVGYE